PVATRFSWPQPLLLCVEFHDALGPPKRSWWPTIARPSAALLVQLLHVVTAALPGTSRPPESEPVRMSCMFGWLPTPLTSSPFSLRAVGLRMLLRSSCRSSTFQAIGTPRALNQGPGPMRSRACTCGRPGAAAWLRYACQVTLPRPAAAASD